MLGAVVSTGSASLHPSLLSLTPPGSISSARKPRRWGRATFRPWRIVPACAALLACVGCLGQTGQGDGRPDDAPDAVGVFPNAAGPPPANENTSVFQRPLVRLVVDFKVHRVWAAKGAFGAESRLWKIATGTLPDAASALRLAANGFRVAVGRESDRKSLLAFLEEVPDLRIAMDEVTPDASRAVELEIGTCDSRQSVFYYDGEGDLRGMDFVKARAGFSLMFELQSTDLREVWLRLVPTLVEPGGRPKWVLNADGTASQVPSDRRTVFDALAFLARVPEGGFLLLAPTESVHASPLLGRSFFVTSGAEREAASDEARESVYVISPTVRTVEQESPD